MTRKKRPTSKKRRARERRDAAKRGLTVEQLRHQEAERRTRPTRRT